MNNSGLGIGVLAGMWVSHKAECKHCKKVDFAKPATLVHLCQSGASLAKAAMEVAAAPALAAKRKAEREVADAQRRKQMSHEEIAILDGKTHVSGAQLKKLMRYVEDPLPVPRQGAQSGFKA